jgi:YegS/Rv2252/BmrU family lipid kinase
MKTLFIVNPRSGARRKLDLTALIRQEFRGDDYEILASESPEHLDAIIDNARGQSMEAVFAVGGDGTVHEVARRIIGERMALGIIPTGSGNGFARHLGIPADARTALRDADRWTVDTIDTAAVNGVPFLAVLGVGFDAFVAERFASSRVRGLQTYVREGMSGFASFHPAEYEITVDGHSSRRRAFVVAVANSSQYGNNALIAPLASLQDGLLDVVVIEEPTLVSAPFLLTRLFLGTLHQAAGVITEQGRAITIRRAEVGGAHVDGEPVMLPETLEVTINPRSLKVLIPRGAKRI